ncbi:glycosyltransferase [Proteinivorax tanatarense]|uniref:Glycosyltransferase n=1 Tax=Proteinivorax tanatarense TaxID=1260629 RepID=A0AAU7VHX2_9FIRM
MEQHDNFKYSVLMSVYIHEEPSFLKQSIESMLNQTYEPDEIVIVKDGKLTKQLNEVINQYYELDPNLFTIVELENNVGLGLALNEGLKKCRNELVARMDTDDVSLPNRCELLVNEFRTDKKLCIVGSYVDEFISDTKKIISSRIVPLEHSEILKYSRRRNPFTHPAVMYKRSKVLELGGYRDFRRNQDLELFVRMLNNNCLSKNIDKPLLLFRANQENLKRRKSWQKCSSYIKLIFMFWRKGYSKLYDVIIIALSQLVVFIIPIKLFEWVSNKILRKASR